MRATISPLRMVVLWAALLAATRIQAAPTFEVQQIADDLTVGYAVRLLDMNEDGRTDILVVDSGRVIWYENPGWQVHTIIQDQTKRDNVCIAPHDIDGDGNLDFALGADWKPANTKDGGTIQWLTRGADPDALWEVRLIAEEPTTHRMQFADVNADGRAELIVLPLMGRDTTKPEFQENGVRVLAFEIPKNPRSDRWPMRVLNDELHVAHNFWPGDFDGDGRLDMLAVSFEGVSWLTPAGEDAPWKRTLLGTGNQETRPSRGASEIKSGRLASGERYIATIEPWHGNQVVVYTKPETQEPGGLWRRHVLDEQLQWGHAVWCANLDSDADEELVIGVRDNKDQAGGVLSGVRVFDPDARGREWRRTLVDPGGVAVEDLAAADLDADGRVDLVAVGRATHNVRIYWNRPAADRVK